MSSHNGHNGTLYGTIGGTLLSVFANLSSGDVLKTVLLASVGATTSFLVSLGMKWLTKALKDFRGKRAA